MSWHTETLSPATLRAAGRIRTSGAHRGFCLVGGTGLALQLGHRYSEDLDFFSGTNELAAPDRRRILAALGAAVSNVKDDKDGWLNLVVDDVTATFLRYGYPLIEPALDWDGIAVASVDDIAAMKITAIVSRGRKRDFVDLFAVCRRAGLGRVLSLAKAKYPDHKDLLVNASYALTYFDDAEKDPMPRLIKSCDWDAVKAYFVKEAPKAFDRLVRR